MRTARHVFLIGPQQVTEAGVYFSVIYLIFVNSPLSKECVRRADEVRLRLVST